MDHSDNAAHILIVDDKRRHDAGQLAHHCQQQRVGGRTMRQEQRPHVPPSVASQQPVPGLTASQHVGYWQILL